MPKPPNDVKNRLKAWVIEESVEKFRKDFHDDHGRNPSHKAVSTFRKGLEKDPYVDRQVEDIMQEAIGSDEPGNTYTIIGSTLLLAVAASLIASFGWEAARPWMPTTALLLTAFGLAFVFYRQTRPFVREHRLVSIILAVLLLACAIMLKLAFGSMLAKTGVPQVN